MTQITYRYKSMLMTKDKSEKTAPDEKSGPKYDTREFKRTLNKLMVDRDIFTWNDLRATLAEVGYEVGQSRFSQYLNGHRSPQELQEFFDAIARALTLSKDERMRLVYSYAYPSNGSKSGPTGETFERAEEVEKIIHRDSTEQVEGEYSNRPETDRA